MGRDLRTNSRMISLINMEWLAQRQLSPMNSLGRPMGPPKTMRMPRARPNRLQVDKDMTRSSQINSIKRKKKKKSSKTQPPSKRANRKRTKKDSQSGDVEEGKKMPSDSTSKLKERPSKKRKASSTPSEEFDLFGGLDDESTKPEGSLNSGKKETPSKTTSAGGRSKARRPEGVSPSSKPHTPTEEDMEEEDDDESDASSSSEHVPRSENALKRKASWAPGRRIKRN